MCNPYFFIPVRLPHNKIQSELEMSPSESTIVMNMTDVHCACSRLSNVETLSQGEHTVTMLFGEILL
jgi:hypothetical protein